MVSLHRDHSNVIIYGMMVMLVAFIIASATATASSSSAPSVSSGSHDGGDGTAIQPVPSPIIVATTVPVKTPSGSTKCVYPREQLNVWGNETIIAEVVEYCHKDLCGTICVAELNRGCELPSSPSPYGGAACFIRDPRHTLRTVCVANGHQISDVSCRICNTTRSPYEWTPATIGTACDNGLFCDGPDHCVPSSSAAGWTTNDVPDYPACIPISTRPQDLPCRSLTNARGCGNYECSEKYHCNAPKGHQCDQPDLIATGREECNGQGQCILHPTTSHCTNATYGHHCYNPKCSWVQGGRCTQRNYCSVTCPSDIYGPDAWWHTPLGIILLGMAGGAAVVIIAIIFIAIYYGQQQRAIARARSKKSSKTKRT